MFSCKGVNVKRCQCQFVRTSFLTPRSLRSASFRSHGCHVLSMLLCRHTSVHQITDKFSASLRDEKSESTVSQGHRMFGRKDCQRNFKRNPVRLLCEASFVVNWSPRHLQDPRTRRLRHFFWPVKDGSTVGSSQTV
jgi:hypothetical protein